MNIAVIFAGGMGTRMNRKDNIPKQFLTVCDKPIIVHTIEIFQNTKEIDAIVVSCIEDWIPHMEDLKNSYNLDKIKKIVKGGSTGQLSIYNGLEAAKEVSVEMRQGKFLGNSDLNKDIVLIHDGVRPVIDSDLIVNVKK